MMINVPTITRDQIIEAVTDAIRDSDGDQAHRSVYRKAAVAAVEKIEELISDHITAVQSWGDQTPDDRIGP